MKNLKYKVIISILVFIAVAVVTVMLTRSAEEIRNGKSVMTEAELPLVYMVSEKGTAFNLLHGYVTAVDESMLHECVTPLPEDRRLKINVADYGNHIDGISYEIRSLDNSQYIENTRVTDFSVVEESKDMGNIVEAVLNIKNLLNEGEEYMLKIVVTNKEKTASYYTRIVQGKEMSLDYKLDYVLHFSEVTYDEEAIKEIIPKLEPDSTGDNTNLGHVNIHSKLSQVGWGMLKPKYRGRIWPYIAEIDKTTADIRLDYQVAAPSSDGEDIYDVQEFFRIKMADTSTFYVLGYDRYVDQVFDGLHDLNESGRIYLGITSGLEEEKLVNDSTGKVTCFVRRGELWSYNSKSNNFVKIFSFIDDDSVYDATRESYGQHGIKVMNIDSDGNVEFVAYGYMNRGSHEGEMGVSVCRYEVKDNIVEEILYVPRNDIFEVIEKDIEVLSYLNNDGRFFMYQGGSIYSIYYDTKEYMVVCEKVLPQTCIFLEKKSVFVYQTGDDINKNSQINLIMLDTGETLTIEAGENDYIKTLGTIDGNLIYGLAYRREIDKVQEEELYPMYKMMIVNPELENVKEYEIPGIRVTGAQIDANKIIISRHIYDSDGRLTETYEDQLMSKAVASDDTLHATWVATELRQKERYIILTVSVPSPTLTKLFIPYEIRFNGEAQIYMSEATLPNTGYRVYGMGKLKLLTENFGAAIVCADEWSGVVVDSEGRIIWDRYKPSSYKQELTQEKLKMYGENVQISGVNLDEALYYVGKGCILKAKTPEGYVLIYEYDKNEVKAVYEESFEIVSFSRKQLEEELEQSGKIVYVLKKINEK